MLLAVQKLTRSGLNGVFGEGLLKDKVAFFEASKNPIPKRRKLLAKRPFYKQKGPCLKRPLNWTGSVFPVLMLQRSDPEKD